MAAYGEAAAAWVAVGIVPVPLGGEDGKRPLVSHPARLGRRAAMDLAMRPRFADAPCLGFWCGVRNGLTVVDIDSPADAEVQHAINTYGDSPVIVETASGKRHLYFAHAGERRRIRPDKGHDIDVLGEGGLAVAPPSERPTGGRYRFVRGGLADLRRLPTMRPGAIAQHERASRQTAPADRVPGADEARNVAMFALARRVAVTATSHGALLDQITGANAGLPVPLPAGEIERTAGMVWHYREQGRLMVPGNTESSLVLPASIADHAMATGNLDVVGLVMMARKYHGEPGKVFALSPVALADADKIRGWGPNRYRYAIREAIDLGLLVREHTGGRGKRDPSLYRFS